MTVLLGINVFQEGKIKESPVGVHYVIKFTQFGLKINKKETNPWAGHRACPAGFCYESLLTFWSKF
jgi:hypothetical protein